jgi:hypothetical protein
MRMDKQRIKRKTREILKVMAQIMRQKIKKKQMIVVWTT